MDKPLESLLEPKDDETMTVAIREWYVGIGIFALFIVVLGSILWSYGQLNQKITPSPEKMEIVASNVPSPTPIISEIKPIYAVWNGSGVAGAAGKLAEQLTAAGYEVVETKNAPATVEGTQVEVTSELSRQRGVMEGELSKLGVVVDKWSSELDNNLGYSIRITIGK